MHSPTSSDACANIVQSLMFYRKGEEAEMGFSKKAIESLVKKLKEKREELDSLIAAITSNGCTPSLCVTIPRTLDGRLQVASRKGFPHVIYSRVWRWPDVHKNELKHLSMCRFAFDLKQDAICVNPYHYERASPSGIDLTGLSGLSLQSATVASNTEVPSNSPTMSSNTSPPHVKQNHSFNNKTTNNSNIKSSVNNNTSIAVAIDNKNAIFNTDNSSSNLDSLAPLFTQSSCQLSEDVKPDLFRLNNGVTSLYVNTSVSTSSNQHYLSPTQLQHLDLHSPSILIQQQPFQQQQPLQQQQSLQQQQQQQPLKHQQPSAQPLQQPVQQPKILTQQQPLTSQQELTQQQPPSTQQQSPTQQPTITQESCAQQQQQSNNSHSTATDNHTLATDHHFEDDYLCSSPPENLYAGIPKGVLFNRPLPDFWCSITYFELDQKVGEICKVPSSVHSITVDGYTNPSSPDRFCLGLLTNVHRTDSIEKARLYIGKGVQLVLQGEGDVWVRCLSEHSIFVQSHYLDREAGRSPGDAVHKIYPAAFIKVFDLNQCRSQMDLLVRQARETARSRAANVANNYNTPEALGSLAPALSLSTSHSIGADDLRRLSVLRLSYVKGWGLDYPRPTIKDTPCWIEVQLFRPLQFLDDFLQSMPATSQS